MHFIIKSYERWPILVYNLKNSSLFITCVGKKNTKTFCHKVRPDFGTWDVISKAFACRQIIEVAQLPGSDDEWDLLSMLHGGDFCKVLREEVEWMLESCKEDIEYYKLEDEC